MSALETLKTKLVNHTAVIGIIGLGYVGLPQNLRFSKAGYKVMDLDIDPSKTGQLNNGSCRT